MQREKEETERVQREKEAAALQQQRDDEAMRAKLAAAMQTTREATEHRQKQEAVPSKGHAPAQVCALCPIVALFVFHAFLVVPLIDLARL